MLNQVLDLIKKNLVIFLKPFHPLSLAVIYTKSKNQKESLINNAKKNLSKRIEEFNSTISEIHECSHEYNEIKNAIDTVKKANIDLIVIFSASSVSDRRDIVPQAIESMHGKIIHFGAKGYPDFRSGTATLEMRRRYLLRAKGILTKEGKKAYLDKNRPNYWAVKYLWKG